MTGVYHKCCQKTGVHLSLDDACTTLGARHSHGSQEEKKYGWSFLM